MSNKVVKEKLIPVLRKILFVALFLSAFLSCLVAQEASLEQNFKNPPPSAKACTWWHWINGNVSKEGITADLEAMKEIGIQGAQLFDVSLGQPKGEIAYQSPEWLDLFYHAALEAQRLGLTLAFHNCAGWSSTGGPSITPEYAMQKVVYTEQVVAGGQMFSAPLVQPETQLGYYKDIAILAFPKPKSNERIEHLNYKSLAGKVRNHLAPDDKTVCSSAVVKKSDIINLTSKLSDVGVLEWDVPEGEWVVLRLGHTPTGAKNRFPSYGGAGLESDKMNSKATDAFWQGGIMPIINKLDTLIGTVVTKCHIDSYEVGTANWTTNFAQDFARLRAYDCHSFLPSLAGYYVESGEETERFLWDFRRTIGDLMAENYYGRFRELCHQYGLLFSAEPYWGPFDNMQVGATADLVMCEFWSGTLAFFDSPKFVASIAKLNGSPIAEAEAFTDMGGWQQHPGALKAMGDLAWAQGINRFVFHSYVHQPYNVPPGLTLGPFGIDFNRYNTWWKQGRPFLDYINRGQFLLQQGTTVADVLVFTGESSPNDGLLIPEIKNLGYDYDLIGKNKIDELSVKDGLICTPHGANYQVFVLHETSWMTPETMKVIEKLAKAGATVLGTQTQKSPSLQNYPNSDKQVATLSDKLWKAGLIKEASVFDFLKNGALPPDFSAEEGSRENLDFIHRKTDEADIYFVANSRKEHREVKCRFRVAGKQPELWNADTGVISNASVWQDNGDGTTAVKIQFESEGSVFVVFRQPTSLTEHIVNSTMELQKPPLQPLLDLKIIKAEYGTFLPDGLVDVTEVLTNSIENNTLNTIANRDLCACDPAPGYHKELRVTYKIGETLYEKEAMEREHLYIDAGSKGELKILKAVFGKFERGKAGIPPCNPVYDVTEQVKSKVAEGVLEMAVDDSFAKGKSSIKTTPALRITYSTKSGEFTHTLPKGRMLKLSQDIPSSHLAYRNGNAIWRTPYPGTLTYKTSLGKTKKVKVKSVPEPVEISGAWQLQFPNIEQTSFDELISWTALPDDNIRYFSGTATYIKEFTVSKAMLKDDISLELDLGSVKEIVELIVNGHNLGILWKAPFRMNIDKVLKEGTNTLEVRVTNLWPNRLIGDEQLPLDYKRKGNNLSEWPLWLLNDTERPSQRTTFPAYKHWHKDSELLPSGLLGPVKVVVFKVEGLK